MLQENGRHQGNLSCKDGHNTGQTKQGPNRSRSDYEEARIHRTNKKKVLMNWIIIMAWSLRYSPTSSSVKWALGSITTNKANGGDGIPAEIFQILKDDAVEVLHSTCQQI